MAITDITYTTRNDEDFTGILAAPDGDDRLPGILFITAIWGVDESARAITGAWADDGFIVSVPDIFWRVHPGPTTDREIAQGRYHAYDFEQGLLDIQDLIGHLRAHPRCNGKIALFGICFGGRYAHIAAARYGIDAAAAYHGTYIERHLDETHKITCPVSFHFGEDDPVPLTPTRRSSPIPTPAIIFPCPIRTPTTRRSPRRRERPFYGVSSRCKPGNLPAPS